MRAIVIAADGSGDLDKLPAEIQTVANTLSANGWIVRLCLGADASRAGLMQAAELPAELVWFGTHSTQAGLVLTDGVWPPSQLGVWLHNVGCRDVVLNSCFGIEHVEVIQRAADVAVVAAINPNGTDNSLAWQTGVHLVRSYVVNRNLQLAARQASGYGVLQYRYVPPPAFMEGRVEQRVNSDNRVPHDEIRDQLASLDRAIRGDKEYGIVGLLERVDRVSVQIEALGRDLNARVEALEKNVTPGVSWAQAAVITAMTTAILLLLIYIFLTM